MKNFLVFFLLLGLGFSQSKVSIQDKEIEINENEAVVEVLGMVCSMCAFGIGEGFSKTDFIDKSKFNYKQIDNLYFFPSNRWDIKLKDDILLKLPGNFTVKKLNHLYEFLENNNKKNFVVVDYRIENQIILNE